MFLNTLQKFNVTLHEQKFLLLFVGMFMYNATLGLYIGALHHSIQNDTIAANNIWITNIALHVFVGICVAVDARFYGGKLWPLQMCIIGCATFITFTLPALLGMYLISDDMTGIVLTLVSIALACFSNAMMISILFELFHRGILQKCTSKNIKSTTRSIKS